ncbi:uncharacterized protein PG986_014969 [Apiospora aurea]|uniref:Uncharacterized protein n=1 Tax=Apiospora aurea TaxID=335848 RepID=A0ABR1PUH0_9PEZI
MQEHQIGGAKVFDEGLEHKLLIAAALVCQPSMESILGARFPSLEFYEEQKSHSTGSLESGPFKQPTHNNGETPEVVMLEATYSVSGVGYKYLLFTSEPDNVVVETQLSERLVYPFAFASR